MNLANKKFFLVLLLTIMSPLSVQNVMAKREHYSSREHIKEAIESILEDEGIRKHRLSSRLYNEYKRAVEKATNAIDNLLDTIESLVFRADLDRSITQAIKRRLREYSIRQKEIPYSMQRAFKAKRKSITKRLKKLMRYNQNEYVTKQEIRSIVKSELDYNFMKELKEDESDSSWSIFDTISNAWSAFVNNSSSSSSHEHSSFSSSTDSTTDLDIYYSPQCPVCQENFYGEERVGALNCGHVFHPECVKQWLTQSKTCPICRRQEAYLAKIYDSKEKVPGYYPAPTTPTQPAPPSYEEPYTTPTDSVLQIYYRDQCQICQSNFYGEERIGALNCGHVFHPECVKQWLIQSKTCPICRRQEAYLAKIYDSKEQVPGYQASQNPYLDPTYPEPSTPLYEDGAGSATQIFYDGECSICLENFTNKQIGRLSCGHTYHPDCIKDWLNQSKTCPICGTEDVYVASIYNSEDEMH